MGKKDSVGLPGRLADDTRWDGQLNITITSENGAFEVQSGVTGRELYILIDQMFYDIEDEDGRISNIIITRTL